MQQLYEWVTQKNHKKYVLSKNVTAAVNKCVLEKRIWQSMDNGGLLKVIINWYYNKDNALFKLSN